MSTRNTTVAAKSVQVLAVALLLGMLAGPGYADFVNAGFELGNSSGWTRGGGTWIENGITKEVTYTPSGDPSKSSIVTGASMMDPLTNNNLHEVLSGNYAMRLNNADNSYHYSTLSQSATWTGDNLYFGWAAVLSEPATLHDEAAAPNFTIKVLDVTRGTTLYSEHFDVYNSPNIPGFQWKSGATDADGTWKYNDWIIVRMDTSAYKGDVLELTATAADCGWGGHGGYAFIDAFSPTAPVVNPDVPTENIVLTPVPEPATMSLLALGGLALIRRRKN